MDIFEILNPPTKRAPSPKEYLDNTYGSNYIVNGQLKHRGFNWNTFDAMYNDAKRLGIPYNTIIGIMANVGLESGGYEDQRQINWKHANGTPWEYLANGGVGLLQFTGQAVPKNQKQHIYDSVLKPHNVQSNYWSDKDTSRSGLSKGSYSIRDATRIYRLKYVRPGAVSLPKAYDIGNYLSKIYQVYFNGGKIYLKGGKIKTFYTRK